MNTWVVVADAARARIFRVEGMEVERGLARRPVPSSSTVLVEIKDILHPESRKHEIELASDAPGMSSVGNMQSKFGMDEKVSPKEEEGMRFAKEVADFLKIQGVNYDQLYLIAPPHFLGLVRPNLDKAIISKLIMEIDKDLSQHSAEEILAHLPTPVAG